MAGKNVHRQLITLNSGIKYKQFSHVNYSGFMLSTKKGLLYFFVNMEMPSIQVVRGFLFNHLNHHRGKLIVYLRSTSNKAAGLYGSTADYGM